jgi:uncharacterized protein
MGLVINNITTDPTSTNANPRFGARYRGLALPLRDKQGGPWEVVYTKEVIYGSILSILTTHPGERVMLPEFGSALNKLVFEPNDALLKSIAKRVVIKAIERWETRISLIDVLISAEEHEFTIQMRYIIKETQSQDSLFISIQRGNMAA